MYLKIVLSFLAGYVEITAEGYYIERFMNECTRNGILLWGIERKQSTILEAKTSIQEFKTLCNLAKKNNCKIKIKRKEGIPFLIKKYRKRKVFLIGLILVILSIYSLSKFIWNVEVEGNERISKDEIINVFKEDGLKPGILKSKVNVQEIINKIRMERTDIAWIGVEIKGTNAIIKVVEADEKPEIVDENEYTNIVASKDAVVERVFAQNGTIMVKSEDEVKKGDVLIAGWMEGKYTGKYYVNSNGEVLGKVKYEQNEKIYKKEKKKVRTGKKERKYALKFNNFKINFYKKLSKFEKYDTIYSSKKIELFDNFFIPIEFVWYDNYELTEVELLHDKDEAESIGKKQAEEKLNKLISGNIVDNQLEITEREDYYDVKVIYTVIENIGTKEKIEF